MLCNSAKCFCLHPKLNKQVLYIIVLVLACLNTATAGFH